jgi:hypothetical protein
VYPAISKRNAETGGEEMVDSIYCTIKRIPVVGTGKFHGYT